VRLHRLAVALVIPFATFGSAAARPAPRLPTSGPAVRPLLRTPTPHAADDSLIATQLHTLMSRLEGLGYNGGLLVIKNGHVLFERSYGWADRAAGVRADLNTVYNLGSITKQFTAACILRLEEQHQLRTTDSIGRWFPNAPADKRAITIHQLLTHTAGFESDFSPTDYEPTTRDEYMRRALASTLISPPGREHRYANSGYSILAAIVELETGQSYEEALTKLVLLPAGMRETGYQRPNWKPARIAHGYQNGRDWGTIVDRIKVPGAPFWALRGNGGLATTLGDIVRWDAALRTPGVFADSTLKKFMTPYVYEDPGHQSQYAYGWAVFKTSRNTRVVAHNGGNGVYVAELQRFVDDGVTVFLTSTVSELPASPVTRTISAILFGGQVTLPPKAVAISDDALRALAGNYSLANGERLALEVRNGHLAAIAGGPATFSLLAAGDTAITPRARELNDKSARIVAAVVAGDARPLHTALGGGGRSLDEVAAGEREMMDSRRERWGAYKGFTVLGTAPNSEGDLMTTVRVEFERGAGTNMYAWGPDGAIMGIDAAPFTAPELIAVGDGVFERFSLRGRAAGVRLVFAGRGASATITVATPAGPVTLKRAP
jgi:CubicO group peptidase (beta-lactamase class C family)